MPIHPDFVPPAPMTFSNRSPDFFKTHDVIDLVTAADRIAAYTQASLDAFFDGVVPDGEFSPERYVIELLDPAVVNDITDATMGTFLLYRRLEGFTEADAAFASGAPSGVPKFGIQSVVEGVSETSIPLDDPDNTVPTRPAFLQSGGPFDGLIIIPYKTTFEPPIIGEEFGITPGGEFLVNAKDGEDALLKYEPPTDNEIQDELDGEIPDPPSVYVLGGVTILSTNVVIGQASPDPVIMTARIFLAVRDV